MALLGRIREDRLSARKSGDSLRINLLTALDGEATRVGKDKANRESTDEEVVAVIRKFLKGIDETIEALRKTGRPTGQPECEREILSAYLPKQLSAEELETVIAGLVAALPEKKPAALGQVMGSLKERYAGLYDGKLASEAIKKALQ